MLIYSIASSIILGTASGYLYATLFLEQKNKIYVQDSTIKFSIYSILRIICFAFLFYYLLPFKTINPILVLLFFLITFWLLILKRGRII